MPATGTNRLDSDHKSIRLTADGFSFYPGSETIVVVGRSTWMPLTEFHADAVPYIYNKVYAPTSQHQQVRYCILPQLEVVELWSVDGDREKELREQYPGYQWRSADGLIVESVWNYERRRSGGRRLYAVLHDGEMLLFDFLHRSLNFATPFWPTDLEEARYLLFAAWQRLGLDAEKDELLLIDGQTPTAPLADGQALTPDTLQPLLRPYIRHIARLTPKMLHLGTSPNIPIDILCV